MSDVSPVLLEILQNADDAQYSREDPHMAFRITDSELIIDSNEDGFTFGNVKAICSTGQSSKADDADTTGEKGFGFKSVFAIARRVHIQSGFWSFRFEHTRNQDGLGMITPIWTDPTPEPPPRDVGTRFRLIYSEDTEQFRQKIVSEFERLPETTIFALRSLRKLEIAFDNIANQAYTVCFERQGNFEMREIRIFTRVTGQTTRRRPSETKIRIFKSSITDLPSDENRPMTTTKVVIGLQVDPTSGEPVVPARGQQVFAYLPIERITQLPVRLPLFRSEID